jgi:mono/diheme cytochrome c family protein
LEIAQPRCGICHTLAAAGSKGRVGPNLDNVQPTQEWVETAVTQGFEAMPAYSETLTQEQIDAVAAYVSSVAGQATN